MRGHIRLAVVPGHRACGPVLWDLPVGDLDRTVPVRVWALHLDDAAWPGLDDGHRDGPGLIIEDLGHAQFFAEDRFHVLISTSTPAGKSRRINESTVLGVGSRMSMSLL